jgi:hypothetical protein
MVGFADEFSSMHPGNEIELAEAMSFLLNKIYRELGPPMRPRAGPREERQRRPLR